MEKLVLTQGSTYSKPVRWGANTLVYREITGVTNGAPAIVSCPSHGIPEAWRVEVVSVLGMTEINSTGKGKDYDYHEATVIDGDTIELNDVNSAEYHQYTGGGYLKFYKPVDLTGYSARMSFKDKIGGVEVLSLTTENGGIVIDVPNFMIMLSVTATQAALLTVLKGVCDLEMVKGAEVTKIVSTSWVLKLEVTT